jgi:hypothetical protein
MQFVAFDERVEVSGKSVLAVVHGMGAWEDTGRRILARTGIEDPVVTGWYPQQAWLDAFKEIAEKIGNRTLFSIGKKIIARGEFPPDVATVGQALERLDIGYHRHHRIEGRVLFDPVTRTLGEGIGHYRARLDGDRSATLTVDTPLPCAFDRGAVTAIAERFKPEGSVVIRIGHGRACRGRDAAECVYEVEW